ncbi:hypothetical protein RCO27_09350 [Sphingosinicella sp. LHD-64]|uniref:hypothetical protein n=1 Tax=Sphingosinicella sp. LHD-64 TaxID=3072139 RepID=UPI00280F32EC|nr:hypothetical protein [Sphingosinicella sp. LHD-64]MDQ8756434.1 hypothetical protein [Sphingosinicella sp. LHD-64]
MRAIICSAALIISAISVPAVAQTAPSAGPVAYDDLPPGCYWVMGRIICVDMPMG